MLHCIYLKFLIVKPTRCADFSNFFLEWNSTDYGQFLCPSSGVFHCTHGNGIRHTGLLTACEQDEDGTAVPSWSYSQAVCKPVWHIPLPCVQRNTHDDGQRNCPKDVEFHSKNKCQKLVHLFGFIIRNLSWCMVTWMSNWFKVILKLHFNVLLYRTIILILQSSWIWCHVLTLYMPCIICHVILYLPTDNAHYFRPITF